MKRIVAGLLAFSMVISAIGIMGNNAQGSDVDEDPQALYQIFTLADLQNVQNHRSDDCILMNDIDASDTMNWNGGQGFATIGDFDGTFDGQGYTISNLYINRPADNNIGLISMILSGSSVTNLILFDADITGASWTGGIVGYNNGGTIDNCIVSGQITGSDTVGGLAGISTTGSTIGMSSTHGELEGDNYVGGLVGDNYGAIYNSFSQIDVACQGSAVGGFVGRTSGGLINRCYASGIVSSDSTVIGGFVGWSDGAISDCYALGNVDGDDLVGGFAGNIQNPSVSIVNCYSTGHVSSPSANIGGFIGNFASGTITSCYWDTTTSGIFSSPMGTGLSTSQMLSQAQYIGWDFNTLWWISDGNTRPILRMEYSTEIANAHQMQLMGIDLVTDYSVIIDIDMSDTSDPAEVWGNLGFCPVGNGTDSFIGTFDGQGHTVSGLNINRGGMEKVGLFGQTDSTASLANISLIDAHVIGSNFAGILVGYTEGSAAVNYCDTSGYVSGNTGTGGLVGYNNGGPVQYSFSSATVDSGPYGGGLVGYADPSGDLSYCYASGNVNTHSHNCAGGLLGYSNAATVSTCYATGDVNGATAVGGLIGLKYGDVSNSYSTGHVTASGANYGGLVGSDGSGSETNCFWDMDTSGQPTTQGGGTGLTTTEALNNFTYTSAGWDFDNVWFSINESTRPFLRWEYNTTIRNSHQLQLMVMDLTVDYEISNDIDMSGTCIPSDMWGTGPSSGKGFSPMGVWSIAYDGYLEGRNYEISNLYINRPTQTAVGLFGWVSNLATISNMTFIDVNITGDANAGALAGICQGQATGCYVSGTITGNDDYIGGLIGQNDGTIERSLSEAEVSGVTCIGGLVGISNGDIFNSTATGNATGINDIVGGLVGSAGSVWNVDGLIYNCQAYGKSDGTNYVGGLVGSNYGTIQQSQSHGLVDGVIFVGGFAGNCSTTSIIQDCVSNGPASASNSNVGGLIGLNEGTVNNCTALGNTEGDTYVGGLIGYNGDSILATVTNCSAHGDVTSADPTSSHAGGLIGRNNIGPINNCNADGNVSATGEHVGGLVGFNNGPVTNSNYSGNVSGTNTDSVGGFVGTNYASVDNCNSYGTVTNNGNRTGGFIGYNLGSVTNSSSNVTVDNSATGNENRYSTGGFIGEQSTSTLTNCQAYGNVSGNKFYTGGFVGYLSSGTITGSASYGFTDITGFSGAYMGGFVGDNWGEIFSCHAFGDTGGAILRTWTGGFVGRNTGIGLIQNSSASGDVRGNSDTGGFAGQNVGLIERCYSESDVMGTGYNVGGFVGWNGLSTQDGDIIDCYSHGNVTGDFRVGGFAGNHTYAGSTLYHVYSTGNVVANSEYGGLVGVDWAGGVTESYWDLDTSGQATSAAGSGRDDEDMMQESNFVNWDFTNIWGIHDANTYPFLIPFGIPAEPSADLNLSMMDLTDPVTLGGILTYNISLINHGPDNAANLHVNITLPAGTTFVESWPDALPVTEGRFIDTDMSDPIYAGETGWVLINVTVDSYGTGTLNCTAWVSSTTTDPGVYPNETYELTEVNRPPIATNDTTQTTEDDIQLIYPDFGILFNDNDPDGDNITVVDFEASDYGATITIAADGNLSYDPTVSAALQALHNNEYVIDSFNYTISDGRGGFDNGTIFVNVSGNEGSPTAVDDAFVINEDSGPQILDVLANDIADEENDAFTISSSNDGVYGTVTVSADGLTLTYEPAYANYTGDDSFTYWISDGGNVISAQVNITIVNVNDAPYLQSNMYFVNEDSGPNTLDVLASAIDGDGDTLEITDVTQGDHGTVAIIQGGTNLTYEPDENFHGYDYFNYTASDGNGGTATLMVKVEVISINDPPVITTESLDDGVVGTAYSFTLTGTDADNQTLIWQGDSNATWLTVGNDGVISGTPTEAGTFWVDVFVFDNGGNGSDTKNFTIEITGTIDPGTDTDGDGIPDITDPDDDNDGVPDTDDAFPLDDTETTDTDSDGIGDNEDAFPTDPAASVDTDGDGNPDDWNDGYTADDSTTGLVIDDDDDGDGIPDDQDDTPSGDETDDEGDSSSSNTWLYLIIILIIAGVGGALFMMRGKGKTPEPVDEPVEEMPEEQPAAEEMPAAESKSMDESVPEEPTEEFTG